MAVFYAVVSGAVGGHMIWSDLKETQGAVESRTTELAHLLDEHTNRTVDSAEQAARRLADRVADLGFQAVSGSAANGAVIAAMLKSAPYLGNLYVVDAAGRVILDGRGFHPAGTDFTDREWVRALAGAGPAGIPAIGSFIGQVAFDDSSRSFSFPVAWRIRDGAGTVLGAAAALVDVDYFKRFSQRLDQGQMAVLGIYRLDGAALVRQPLKIEEAGRSLAEDPLFTTHLRQGLVGTYRGQSPHDGMARVVSYRVIPERNLVVWVGIGEEAMLDAWRLRALRVLGLVLGSLAVMAVLTAALVRELARGRQESSDLSALNRDLERSNADLEQFAYIASHDLKEPLRNIASYVQLLQRRYRGRLDPDADAFIGYTVDGVRRMQSIINELLAYSRIGTGRLTLAPVQAGILVSTALAHLKGVIADAQAAVEVKGPLPVVEADSAQLGSLFQNLISNALKYRRDDVRPEVEIGCADEGRVWSFYVRDNGIGIDPQYHRQIFDLFKRLHPRDCYSGTGIGLAICQRVVERHGGRIWVESETGRGSTFWFSLPKRPVG